MFEFLRPVKKKSHPTPPIPATFAPPVPSAAPSILDSYSRNFPDPQNAIDIFAGEWVSQFPPPLAHLKAGGIPLFQDSRIAWALDVLGGVKNQNILELGPLEAGHSYMLEKAGAAQVTAIEANTRAYLKCLISKQIFELTKVRFLCGDFLPYLEECDVKFDLVLAAGVLYHMKNPLRLLQLICKCTNRIYLWTHYYDADVIRSSPHLAPKFVGEESVDVNGVLVTLHRQEYAEMLAEKSFCGGSETFSKWITRDGLLHVLRSKGFTDFQFSGEMPDHPHGPCFSLVASRFPSRGISNPGDIDLL